MDKLATTYVEKLVHKFDKLWWVDQTNFAKANPRFRVRGFHAQLQFRFQNIFKVLRLNEEVQRVSPTFNIRL